MTLTTQQQKQLDKRIAFDISPDSTDSNWLRHFDKTSDAQTTILVRYILTPELSEDQERTIQYYHYIERGNISSKRPSLFDDEMTKPTALYKPVTLACKIRTYLYGKGISSTLAKRLDLDEHDVNSYVEEKIISYITQREIPLTAIVESPELKTDPLITIIPFEGPKTLDISLPATVPQHAPIHTAYLHWVPPFLNNPYLYGGISFLLTTVYTIAQHLSTPIVAAYGFMEQLYNCMQARHTDKGPELERSGP